MVCDICDTPGRGTIVSASNFKKAVRNGFNPVQLELFSHSVWTYELWKNNALNSAASYSDWNICSNCLSKLKPYIESSSISNNVESLSHSNDGCYIATACYGDFNAPQVLVFRQLRDNFLIKSSSGLKIVKLYYQYSPYWAEKLKIHSLLNKIVKSVFLDPVYKLLILSHKYNNKSK